MTVPDKPNNKVQNYVLTLKMNEYFTKGDVN
jgi:hypothetical protein